MISRNRGLVAVALTVALTSVGTPGCTSQNPLAPGGIAFFSFTDIQLGSGAIAATGNRAVMNYVVWLFEDGESENKGPQVDSGTLTFVVGANQVIGGFDQGVLGMRVGGQRQLIIPPDLALGFNEAVGIPADSSLVAELELIDVQVVITDTAPFTIIDLVVGDGAQAATGDQLFLAYGGWLYDESQPESKGALFDASDTSGFSFKLGAGQVITGWDEGLVGMRENGERRLIIPPDLAYGDNSPGIIPPNATLLFDITLLTVTPE
ncbi:MAG: FKBP-type peptidyl-prolyl cis-trans isomerase [bacterium]